MNTAQLISDLYNNSRTLAAQTAETAFDGQFGLAVDRRAAFTMLSVTLMPYDEQIAARIKHMSEFFFCAGYYAGSLLENHNAFESEIKRGIAALRSDDWDEFMIALQCADSILRNLDTHYASLTN